MPNPFSTAFLEQLKEKKEAPPAAAAPSSTTASPATDSDAPPPLLVISMKLKIAMVVFSNAFLSKTAK